MRRIGELIVNGALAASALTVGGSVAYRTFHGPQLPPESVRPTRMREWNAAIRLGRTISGDDNATTTVAVFGDLQCPACRGYHEAVIKRIEADHPRDVRIVFINYPLAYHKYALPAARATECVTQQKELGKWIDLIYELQDSLGIASWGSLAARAGLGDTISIVRCATTPERSATVDAALRLGKDFVRGTPTVAINGWVYPHPPTFEQVDSVINAPKR